MKDDFKAYLNEICIIKLDAMEDLLDLFRPTNLSAKQFFVRAGAYADKVGFLKAGVVRAFFVNDAGKEYTKQFFVGPSLIGAYTSLLTKRVNKIAQQALTDCEILEANYSELEALYKKHHSLERLGRKIAEFYFLEKEQKELEMGLLDADQRYDIFRDRFPHLESSIAQYHIASYLGVSPTQLSRIRNKRARF